VVVNAVSNPRYLQVGVVERVSKGGQYTVKLGAGGNSKSFRLLRALEVGDIVEFPWKLGLATGMIQTKDQDYWKVSNDRATDRNRFIEVHPATFVKVVTP